MPKRTLLLKGGTAGKRQEESLGAVVGSAGKQEGVGMDRPQFPVQFLSSLLYKAILGLWGSCRTGTTSTGREDDKPVCFGYIEKFKPFFAAFQTAGCDDLASRGRFAEGPRKREITRKL